MMNVKTNYLTLKEIEKELKNTIETSFVGHITLLSNVDLLFTFSHYRQEKLLISLKHSSPFISLIEIDEPFQTIMCPLNEALRKEIKDTKLTNIKLSDDDRIFEFKFDFTNELFEKETRYLILELIPTKPNLLILDKERKIIFATHYADLTKNRPILKGQTYVSPSSSIKKENHPIDLVSLKERVNEYLDEIKSRRLKTKYAKLFTLVNKKVSSLQRKIEKIKLEIEQSKAKLIYKDYGNLIYSIINEPELLDEYITEGYIKNYDRDLDLTSNANRYFKIYKKAKSAIAHGEEEITKAFEEIDYYTHLKIQIENGSDEDIAQIESLIIPQTKNTKKIKDKQINPYSINVNGVKIYFGKSDLQNDKLTFALSKPTYHFFHVKDYSGAHVVIFSDNPSNDLKLIASEICLILSKKEDGDVYSTQIKNVRKGHRLGQVNLKSFETFYLNKVRKETKDLIKKASH